jgi:signal transduction histidine kinase
MTAQSISELASADPTNDELQRQLIERTAERDELLKQNARLLDETREALERQTATADILKVIASSPDDMQPVFEAIAQRGNRMVSGMSTAVFAHIGDMAHLRAFSPISPAADAALKAMFPMKLAQLAFAEILSRGEIHSIPDTELDPMSRNLGRARGFRSILFLPLISDRTHIGSITITRKDPGVFADEHVQMMQTFADQASIAISNARLFQQVQERTRQLSTSLSDLRAAQDRLVQAEKLASLGQLTAGIAHEIKNPLNFVNNFSSLSGELLGELCETLEPINLEEKTRLQISELTGMLKGNLERIVQHGKRADSIVKNMLLHSRRGSGKQQPMEINSIVEESLNLAYHGARAEKSGFNITLQRDLDPNAGMVDLYPQEIARVFLNLIMNGFYAATKRKEADARTEFEPIMSVATKNRGDKVEIRIRDNGTGIPDDVKGKMFDPFFTTKPAGEGTGLGLSMSHDIVVKQHGGSIDVATKPGEFTEFLVVLPRAAVRQEEARDRS